MTVVRDPRRLGIVVVAIVLTGATVFGLWHVVVGWLLHGNPRAGTFGVVLAAAAGTLLALVLIAGRRVLRA